MKALTLNEAADFLRSRDNFVILTHRKPDGDTVGSAAALCLGLRSLGKTAFVLQNPQLTDNFAPFMEGLTCEAVPQDACIVTVDIAGLEMFGKGMEGLEPEILFDHHDTNRGFAPRGIVRGEAAACCELIYDVLLALGVKLDKPMAEAIYLGTATDTGCFRYANTRANTLRVAAACIEAGADTYPINRIFFETVRLSRLKLDSYMAEHMELLCGGQIALCPIPLDVEKSLGVHEDDMGNVCSFLRNIQGVQLAVTFRTDEEGNTKLSVRGAPGWDASALCVPLGGGGHKGAAGATLRCGQEAARAKALEVLKELEFIS